MAAVIITLLNEEKTIIPLLEALKKQTVKPTEVVITDGGSTDSTVQLIKVWQKENADFPVRLLIKSGNRSVGRNEAMSKVSDEVIAITDGGCIPEAQWLEQLLHKYRETKAPVVAGYYKGAATSLFTKATAPFFLVMPDKAFKIKTFLPATRSMLITKQVWEKLQGFNEELFDNEDYEFAKKIENQGFQIEFAPLAIVNWQPPSTLAQFVKTIFRFARGDIYAGILRPQVVLVCTRYILLATALFIIAQVLPVFLNVTAFILLLTYSVLAINKNARYVGKAWWLLPLLQYSADFAVITGSLAGLLSLLMRHSRLK